ncbi:MAG TPA: hypothetical protein PLD37_06350 [Usitatibacteraceae bacterium]|nr:hypothetical protein [Usitatibacteraceae bacterium]
MATTTRGTARKAKAVKAKKATTKAKAAGKTTKKTAKKAVKKAPARKAPVKKAPAPRKAAKKTVAKRATSRALELAGVGTDAVAKATGKAWDRWLALLDAAGAAKMPHKAIAKLLSDRFGVPGWWSQMIAVGYEQARGLREPNQKADGFAANASRTVAAGLDRLYGAWTDPSLRALWLGAVPVEIRRATDGKSIRLAWKGGESTVEVHFVRKAPGRSQVAVQHGRLSSRAAFERQKSFWGGALDRLKALLEKAA